MGLVRARQAAWQDLTPAESNSCQLRWQGERAMLQQAANFQEAHNDNLGTPAFGDGLWVMFDYNRGYAPDVESSGCVDLLRIPKYSYHFFRSQRPAASGAMVFVASEWREGSAADVRVFSNCDEVALYLDGDLIARQRPDRNRVSTASLIRRSRSAPAASGRGCSPWSACSVDGKWRSTSSARRAPFGGSRWSSMSRDGRSTGSGRI